jgi:hypothetical protein
VLAHLHVYGGEMWSLTYMCIGEKCARQPSCVQGRNVLVHLHVYRGEMCLLTLKVHMHEILWFVFHNFLASFNNRQGRGPEFQKF